MKKYNINEDKIIKDEINKIINNSEYKKLINYRHHKNTSTYVHSIRVAYYCYCFIKKFNIKINKKELIKAALLHDLYFYDWHDKNNNIHFHGLKHPKTAITNAKIYFNISKREIRHMKHHMFPLTLLPPTTKEGWIICICDKLAAIKEYKKAV